MTLTTLTSAELTATISPLGAELQSLTTASGAALLWHGDPQWWSGRAPLLFPIVGKAPEDRIRAGGQEAEMGQHGFARRRDWRQVSASENDCLFELGADTTTRALYPFDFRLSLRYRLEGACLTVSCEIANEGTAVMPFGIGFHPAFLWPLPGARGRLHEVRLANGAEPALLRLRDGLLDDTPLPSPFRQGRLRPEPADFEADAMIFPEGAGEALSFGVPEGPQLAFRFDNLPNLALWQKPGAPYLCIEPWHGMAARHGAGPDIAQRPCSVLLDPGETMRCGWSVTVSGVS